MALSDLLWACPVCGEDRGLRGDGARCSSCGTRFERVQGARIRATDAQGVTTIRSAAEWTDALPDPASLVDCARRTGEGTGAVRSARGQIRPVVAEDPVFGESGYLNRVEVFDDPAPGELTLTCTALQVDPEAGPRESWPLETLTAVQASSSTLQIKRRGEPLVAFRLDDDSIYLWEQLLHAVLRDFYGRTGRGEIVEFQPRIATR